MTAAERREWRQKRRKRRANQLLDLRTRRCRCRVSRPVRRVDPRPGHQWNQSAIRPVYWCGYCLRAETARWRVEHGMGPDRGGRPA
jgi:hypothetical protein